MNNCDKTTLEENILCDYNLGLRVVPTLVEKYKCSGSFIYKILKKVGYTPQTNRGRVYTLDENLLDNLYNPDVCYFLGYFCADGTHSRRNRSLRIKLAEQDKEILDKFKDLFNSNKPLYKYCRYDGQDQFELTLSSKKLSDKIIEIGIPEKKTEFLQFPDYIPEKYLRDYIRGYYDGDGTLGVYGLNKTVFSMMATSSFCESLKEHFKNKLDTNCSIVKYPKKYKIDIAVLFVSGNNQIKKVLDYLYKDANLSLNRKWAKYMNFTIRRVINEIYK
jgi:intein/homing endonuclease